MICWNNFILLHTQDVENMNTSAEEMELYASVNRKFRQVFHRQEHMRTFKTYDRIEVGFNVKLNESKQYAFMSKS